MLHILYHYLTTTIIVMAQKVEFGNISNDVNCTSTCVRVCLYMYVCLPQNTRRQQSRVFADEPPRLLRRQLERPCQDLPAGSECVHPCHDQPRSFHAIGRLVGHASSQADKWVICVKAVYIMKSMCHLLCIYISLTMHSCVTRYVLVCMDLTYWRGGHQRIQFLRRKSDLVAQK